MWRFPPTCISVSLRTRSLDGAGPWRPKRLFPCSIGRMWSLLISGSAENGRSTGAFRARCTRPILICESMSAKAGCSMSLRPQRASGLCSIVPMEGTVNLIGFGRDTAHEGRSHERLCPSGHAGDLSPGLEGLGSGGSILGGGAVIAAKVEQVVDLVVSGEEALSLAG